MSGYVLTDTAENELREILRFVAESAGESRTVHVLEAFLEAFETLAGAPNIGFRRAELTGPTVRWWPVFRFLVLYEPEPQPMTVMRILHGARDLDLVFPRGGSES